MSNRFYTAYQAEDDLQQTDGIALQVVRKHHSKRPDAPCLPDIKQTTRHFIETVFSGITMRFPKAIHAVTSDGFLLKVATFIIAFTVEAAFLT